jgi:hypothetical protein
VYPRPHTTTLRLTPGQTEFLYWELTSLLAQYIADGAEIDPADETTLRLVISRLEASLDRAESLADFQLDQLRRINSDALRP